MIHFDLKGTPPIFSRLLEWLDLVKLARFNAVLVEWEDTFSWMTDKRFRGKTCYTPEQIKEFAQKAAELGIQIIPLIQSLGHLETVLGLEDYALLREIPERIDCLNPLAPGAGELIDSMLEEMLSAFPDINYLHIGGDEVWSFGQHPATKEFIKKHSEAALYRKFMTPLLEKIIARGIRPIIWHDMLNSWDITEIHDFTRKTDLMVWGYRGTPDTSNYHYRREVIDKFAQAGAPMWAAGMFKGRFDLPWFAPTELEFEDRLLNTQGWLDAQAKYGMKGICLTAWARNSTATHQNMPIEVNLDYMIYMGTMLWQGKKPDIVLKDAAELMDAANSKQFKKRLAAFEAFREQTAAYWLKSQYLRHVLAAKGGTRKNPGGPGGRILETLKELRKNVEEKGAAFVKALYPTMDKHWADALVNTRLAATKQDLQDISNILRSQKNRGH
jgi:hexosaminidase